MNTPSPDAIRETFTALDPRQTKIVLGMFGLMIAEPGNVRDREWMSEQLTRMALWSEDAEPGSADEAIDDVRAYLAVNAEDLLRASFLLFQRVAEDLAPRATTGGFTFEDAMQVALTYLPSGV
ncbi:MAG: hypothetical protein H6834_18040 [Planctomycetes bacterium]|nr:hypothetical protein [Planctomycetota bacterium]